MNLSEEEFEKIVVAVCERVLNRQAEIIGNLMENHIEIHKMTKGFYKKYPEFKKDPLTARAVFRELEEKHPGVKYDELLKKSVPLIRSRLKTIEGLDIKDVPSRDKLDLNIDIGDNGEL